MTKIKEKIPLYYYDSTGTFRVESLEYRKVGDNKEIFKLRNLEILLEQPGCRLKVGDVFEVERTIGQETYWGLTHRLK